MREDNNKLDSYLQNKVEEADFSFDEKYWEKAEQMLDEQDKKKRRPLLWAFLTGVAALVVLGVGTLFHHNDKTSETNKQYTNEKPSTAQTEKSYVQDKPENLNQNNTSENNNETNNAQTPVTEPSQANRAHSTNTQGTNTIAVTTHDTKSTTASPTKPTEHTINPTPKLANNTPADKKVNTDEKNKENITVTKQAPETDKQNTDSGSLTNKENENKKENIVKINGRDMKAIDTQVILPPVKNERIRNPRYDPALAKYIAERIDSTVVLTYKPVEETLKLEEKKETQEAPKQEITQVSLPAAADTHVKKPSKVNYFVNIGGNLNKGLNGNSKTSVPWGVSPYFNIGTQVQVNKEISISAQIGFTYFNAMNVEKHVYNYKYSFGLDSTKFIVSYQRMYQISIPITIAYKISKSSVLSAALGGSYLINTLSKVNNNGTSSQQSGYMHGINPLDLFAQFGYQFNISKRFSLLGLYQQGFMNTIQNEYFDTDVSSRQKRISIGFKYYFKRNGN